METSHKRIRVLMIGPGAAVIGGISTLTRVVVPVLAQQVDLYYLPTVLTRPEKKGGKVSLRNIALAASQYARFTWACLRFRPHVVHLHTTQGLAWLKDTFYLLLGKLGGSRVVLHFHAADFDVLYGKRGRLMQAYTRWAMGRADAVIAVSAEWKSLLAQIVPTDRVSSFRNCIALDARAPGLPRAKNEHVKALFLGTIGPRKGAFDLIEAMRLLKARGCSLQLWIAGDEQRKGDLTAARARLEEAQLEDTCHLAGVVRGRIKAQLLSEANLFVLPSYNEGLPMAILEALTAGLAVVATPVGGIPEVIQDGYNGFLVDPGNPQALADKLALLAGDPVLCEKMGSRSRDIAEKELGVQPYVQRLVALYESLGC